MKDENIIALPLCRIMNRAKDAAALMKTDFSMGRGGLDRHRKTLRKLQKAARLPKSEVRLRLPAL